MRRRPPAGAVELPALLRHYDPTDWAAEGDEIGLPSGDVGEQRKDHLRRRRWRAVAGST